MTSKTKNKKTQPVHNEMLWRINNHVALNCFDKKNKIHVYISIAVSDISGKRDISKPVKLHLKNGDDNTILLTRLRNQNSTAMKLWLPTRDEISSSWSQNLLQTRTFAFLCPCPFLPRATLKTHQLPLTSRIERGVKQARKREREIPCCLFSDHPGSE